MKKEFLYKLSLAFVICLSSDVYSCLSSDSYSHLLLGVYSMKSQVTGEMKIGHVVYPWQVEGKPEFCDFMKKRLATNQDTGQQQNFIIPSIKDLEKPAIQIDPDGGLSINQGEHIIVRDRHGKTIIDTSKNQGQFYSESFDEGDIKRRIEKLQPGDSLIAFFSGDSKVSVTFDNIIKLVSKIDRSEYPVRLSQVADSALVAVGMNYGEGEKEKTIELASTGQEIKTFLDFVASNEEGRKKLLSGLPMIEYATLTANFRMHDFPKEFNSDYYDSTMSLLRSKIHASLEEGELEWVQEINTWPSEAKMVIEDILRSIIRPVPKVVWECKATARSVSFSKNGKRATIIYKDGRWEIRDTEDWKVLFEGKNIKKICFSPDETKALIEYKNNEWEIIDLENREPIFKGNNIKRIDFNLDGTKILIEYKNNEWKIRDLENREILFESNNIKKICFSPDGMKVLIVDNNGRGEISDLENRKILFESSNIKWMDFNSDETWLCIKYQDGKWEIRNLEVEDKTVFFEDKNIRRMYCNSDRTRAWVEYIDGYWRRKKIIDLEDTNRELIFKDDEIEEIRFSPDGTKAKITYYNSTESSSSSSGGMQVTNTTEKRDRWKIIDIKDKKGKVLDSGGTWAQYTDYDKISNNGAFSRLTSKNRWSIERIKGKRELDSANVRILCVKGEDARGKIEVNREVIFSADNVKDIDCNSDKTRAWIKYEDGRIKIIDFADCNRDIVFRELTPEQLLFVFNLKKNWNSPTIVNNFIKDHYFIWQSFSPDQQQELKKSYFPSTTFPANKLHRYFLSLLHRVS